MSFKRILCVLLSMISSSNTHAISTTENLVVCKGWADAKAEHWYQDVEISFSFSSSGEIHNLEMVLKKGTRNPYPEADTFSLPSYVCGNTLIGTPNSMQGEAAGIYTKFTLSETQELFLPKEIDTKTYFAAFLKQTVNPPGIDLGCQVTGTILR